MRCESPLRTLFLKAHREGDSMKNLKHNIFGSKDERTGRKRYWISVRTRRTKDGDDFIDASLPCNLSKEAEELFGQYCQATRSKDVYYLRSELTDWWFKAVETKDGKTFTVAFVNRISVAKDDNKTSW